MSLLSRFWTYQSERFPFFGHGPLILAFSFSAVSYSRLSRGETGFIPLTDFLPGFLTCFSFFLLLRLFDEFKDAEDDARYRPYRPVPRGLISLREIGFIAAGLIIFQLVINLIWFPVMVLPWILVMAYMTLMTREFFIPTWLKAHPVIYMVSHMIIMPFIDFYSTGLDWILSDATPSFGLVFFLIVTFFNGMVIELGRKIRAPEMEEVGVETYSALYGFKKASGYWIILLAVTAMFAIYASLMAGYSAIYIYCIVLFAIISIIPAVLFLNKPKPSLAKAIENSSGIWTLAMYLILGGVPGLLQWI